MTEHAINLFDRQNMVLSGINNVITFDEEEIILETIMGNLSIQGEELHISMLNLDEGKVELNGSVNSISYKPQGSDIKNKSKNVLNRLFK